MPEVLDMTFTYDLVFIIKYTVTLTLEIKFTWETVVRGRKYFPFNSTLDTSMR